MVHRFCANKNKFTLLSSLFFPLNKHSLSILLFFILIFFKPQSAKGQIFLSPQNPQSTRSSATINIDGTRCSSTGGNVPSLTMSVGADPYALTEFGEVETSNNKSPFLGIVSLNIPLTRTGQAFNCNELHDLAVKKSKLNTLREMVDEEIITDQQYIKAVQSLYGDILFDQNNNNNSAYKSTLDAVKRNRSGGVTIRE